VKRRPCLLRERRDCLRKPTSDEMQMGVDDAEGEDFAPVGPLMHHTGEHPSFGRARHEGLVVGETQNDVEATGGVPFQRHMLRSRFHPLDIDVSRLQLREQVTFYAGSSAPSLNRVGAVPVLRADCDCKALISLEAGAQERAQPSPCTEKPEP
jgi:hypothetical protein